MNNNELKQAILVGRHTNYDELASFGFGVMEQYSVLWKTDPKDCYQQLDILHKAAKEKGACLLFQNIPAILATVLYAFVDKGVEMYVVISEQSETDRAANVQRTFQFVTGDLGDDAAVALELVKFVNGRAKAEIVYGDNQYAALVVTVDPVPVFKTKAILPLGTAYDFGAPDNSAS